MEPSSTQPSAFKSQVSHSSPECGVLIDKATGHPNCVYLDIQEGAPHAQRGSGKMLAIVPVVLQRRKPLTKTRKERVLKELRDLRAIVRASGESLDGSIDKVSLRTMSALDTSIEIIKESDL
jgi:hypothetical protein